MSVRLLTETTFMPSHPFQRNMQINPLYAYSKTHVLTIVESLAPGGDARASFATAG